MAIMTALPSDTKEIVEVPNNYKHLVETADVWWYINHYETYCEANGITINPKLYL